MSSTTATRQVSGSLPAIIRNDERLYEGDLQAYFQIVFQYAQNLHHPYHNFRHMFHVVYLCYDACLFYEQALSSREMRNLLIAAMFHDFDHAGVAGDDARNIEAAINGLQRHIQEEDWLERATIAQLIRATQYPYVIEADSLSLSARILRDADVAQAFSPAWIQQVVFGLAAEWGKKPIDVLRMQVPFYGSIDMLTDWGVKTFPPEDIASKITEAEELLALIEV